MLKRVTKHLFTLLKFGLTFVIVYYAVKDVDFTATKAVLSSSLGLILLALFVLTVLFQTLLGGYRYKLLLQLFGFNISTFRGTSLLFLGNFFSQTFISFVGGDAMRVVAVTRCGVNTRTAVSSIFLDRVLGFIGVFILFMFSLPFMLDYLRPGGTIYWGMLSIGTLASVMVIGFFVLGVVRTNLPKLNNNHIISKILDLASVSRYLLQNKSTLLATIILSTCLQFSSILMICLAFNFLGGTASLFETLIIASPVMFLAQVPISISGWGVRESAMIVGFGLIGISSDLALTVSVMVGLGALIASLPGALVMLGKYKPAENLNNLSLDRV